MNKKDEILNILVIVLIEYILIQCVFTDNVVNTGHEIFVKMGISDEIEKIDKYLLGE